MGHDRIDKRDRGHEREVGQVVGRKTHFYELLVKWRIGHAGVVQHDDSRGIEDRRWKERLHRRSLLKVQRRGLRTEKLPLLADICGDLLDDPSNGGILELGQRHCDPSGWRVILRLAEGVGSDTGIRTRISALRGL